MGIRGLEQIGSSTVLQGARALWQHLPFPSRVKSYKGEYRTSKHEFTRQKVEDGRLQTAVHGSILFNNNYKTPVEDRVRFRC